MFHAKNVGRNTAGSTNQVELNEFGFAEGGEEGEKKKKRDHCYNSFDRFESQRTGALLCPEFV